MEKKKLTGREKILISIVIAAGALFLAFNFLIVPAFNNYSDKSEEVEILKTEKALAEDKIATYLSKVENYNRTREEFDEIKALFPESLTSYELDQLLTELCKRHGLDPTYLDIYSRPPAEGAAMTNATLRVSVSTQYPDITRFVTTINSIDYLQLSSFNYILKEDFITVDMGVNVQMYVLGENFD
ncbi:MAG: hypothetical protein FWG36_00115 [Oscillospiraceae bacterium]|nr:hypothetical protein [Oscillospiraceae bacterium]